MYLNNHSQRPLGLWGVKIEPQSSEEVEGDKKEWANHMFVKAGWITVTDEPENVSEAAASKKKRGRKKQQPEPPKDEPTKDEPLTFGGATVVHVGGGWYDVQDEDGNNINLDKSVRKEEAIELAQIYAEESKE